MTLSAELTRFLADHATADSWAAFASGIGTAPTAATLAAAMSARGYQVGEADVVAALKVSKQSALADQQLDAVVGGQGTDFGDLVKIMMEYQKNAPARSASDTMSETVATMSEKASRAMDSANMAMTTGIVAGAVSMASAALDLGMAKKPRG